MGSKIVLGEIEAHFCGQSNTSSGCGRASFHCYCKDVLSKELVHTQTKVVLVFGFGKGFDFPKNFDAFVLFYFFVFGDAIFGEVLVERL